MKLIDIGVNLTSKQYRSDVDDVIAHLLVTEGFSKVEEVAFVQIEDLTDIEGFDEDVASELQTRAQTYLETRDAEFDARRARSQLLFSLGQLTPANLFSVPVNAPPAGTAPAAPTPPAGLSTPR